MTNATQQTTEKHTIIQKGDRASIEYTGTFKDGSVFDSSSGRAPLQFEVGAGQVIPGFEKAVEGMKVDEEKTFTIAAEEAYGPIRAELVQEVPTDKLPKDLKPEQGMQLLLQGPQGERMPVTITKVSAESVTIDMNHPLAGKELTFKIKLVGINEEIEYEEGGCGSGGCGDGGCGSGKSESGGCGSGGCGSGSCGSGGCGEGGCGSGKCGSGACADEDEKIDHTQ